MTPNYKTNDPRGWCGDPSRGAALGRATIQDESTEYADKLYIKRVRLHGDYDSNGTYFGQGAPLYWVSNDEGTVDYVLRASCRASARDIVLKDYPKAKVRR